MPEIVFLVVKLVFVALLWAFVLTVASAIRADLFGVRPAVRAAAVKKRSTPAPRGSGKPKAAKSSYGGKAPTYLLVTAGSLAGSKVPLGNQPIILGRAPDSTLVLTDDYASTRHAVLTPGDGTWVVEDLGSTNGTYLGNTKLTGPTPIPPGVPIVIGQTSIELRA